MKTFMEMKLPKLLYLGQFVLLALGSASTPLQAAAVSQNEFWISAVPTGTTSHAGTIGDPYDGSADNFDTLINDSTKIPANCTVHLLGGTYLTAGGTVGGFVLKTGQKILGSGIDITTVKLVGTSPSCVMQNGILTDTGIEISDLTVDANAQNLAPNTTYSGIILIGSGGSFAIRRVKVQGLAHGAQATETWGFLVTDQGIADRVIVEDCVIMPPVAGSNCTSICVGGSARVSGNWVYGTNMAQFNGIGVGNSLNTILSGNHVLNADFAIRSEVGNTNLTVVNNSLQNVAVGVGIYGGVNQNLYFAGNTFELTSSTNEGTYAFSHSSGAVCINEKIIGNTIKAYGTSGPSFYALGVDNATNVIVADNSIDNTFKWNLPGCTNVILRDNVDLLGNFLTSSNQTELPNSLTRRIVKASTYTAQYQDRYIGVQLGAGVPVTINLPSPVGYGGKEYIIVNERGSGTVSVTPLSGNINGSTAPVTIPIGYGNSLTVTSDGSNWFAR